MKDFKELIVWRKAHAVTLTIYAATRVFPKEETIRTYEPTQAFRGIDRSKHCGGLRPPIRWRDVSLLTHRLRFSD